MIRTIFEKCGKVDLKKTSQQIQTSFKNSYLINRSIGTNRLEVENVEISTLRVCDTKKKKIIAYNALTPYRCYHGYRIKKIILLLTICWYNRYYRYIEYGIYVANGLYN